MPRDFFDDALAAPSLSYEEMPKGTRIVGIQIGDKVDGVQKDTKNNTKYFPIAGTDPPMPDLNAPMPQTVITLLTDFRDYEFVSAAYLQKAEEAGEKDDGRRRIFIKGSPTKGANLNKKYRDALRAAGAKRPVHGSIHTITFVRRSPIPGSVYKQNDFEVEYQHPTPESLAKVAQFVDLGPVEPATSGAVVGGYDDEEPAF